VAPTLINSTTRAVRNSSIPKTVTYLPSFLDYIVQQQYQPRSQQPWQLDVQKDQMPPRMQQGPPKPFDQSQVDAYKQTLDLKKTKICPNIKQGVINLIKKNLALL
jgi:hypothetical protein